MAGCSSSGFRPMPPLEAPAPTKGFDAWSATSSTEKKPEMTISTITAPPVRRSLRSMLRRAITVATIARNRSQSRNEPCAPAQKPATR